MSNIDELRSKFYDEDDDPFGSSSTSGSVSGRGARTSSSTAAVSSSSVSRPAPYPQARARGSESTSYTASTSSRGRGYNEGSRPSRSSRGKGKGRDSGGRGGPSFVERARNAPDDDDPFLAGVLRGEGESNDRIAGEGAAMDVDVDPVRAREEREARENDVQRLMRAWQDERHSPDILPAKDALLGRVLDAIRRQTDDVNALRTAPDMSEEEHYMTMLVQTEVERMKFVVRSYVRTRLFKIEQFAAYITSSPEIQARLTEAELRHAQRYAELIVSQFRMTVLNNLPEAQQALDDDVPTMPNMITEPDKDRPVFCHTFERINSLMLSDGTTEEVKKGTIIMTPYRTVEQLLLRGEVELV